MNYQDAIGKISWGYLFIYISLNLGSVNIFPSWAGFLLIYLALGAVAAMDPSAKLLKPFALLLLAEDLAEWVLNIFSMAPDLYWVDVFINVIILYFSLPASDRSFEHRRRSGISTRREAEKNCAPYKRYL